MVRKATVVIEKDDHGFYAWCPELRGCRFQGPTVSSNRSYRELKFTPGKTSGLPCSLQIGHENIYAVNGFARQLLKLDLSGDVPAAVGKRGKGRGAFGEAHFIADTVNATLHKFVKKPN
jgi:hypothetical protein